MRLVVRADASRQIGSGHVMRCLTLAQAMRDEGAEVGFICRRHAGNLIDLLLDAGFPVHSLVAQAHPTTAGESLPAHAHWLGTRWRDDAAETRAVLDSLGHVDWLVVDHYALDRRWERAVRPSAQRLMVIDDLADRDHDCDLLLDQNLTAAAPHRYDARVPRHCRTLLGPRYALLRPEFAAARRNPRPRDGQVRQILVFFGGVDADDLTSRTVQAIHSLGRADVQVDVVVGGTNSHRGEIERLCADMPGFRCLCQVADMAALMTTADLAIGAGGVALLERVALALPSIVLALAENQQPGCRALALQGGALFLGRAAEVSHAALTEAIRLCLAAPELLCHMAGELAGLTDAKGLDRVVAALLPGSALSLRRAGREDCLDLWRWRNAESVRRYSGDPAPIDYVSHQSWLEAVLTDPDRDLLIGEDELGPVGVLRYDIDGDCAAISVYLVPNRQGRGLGTTLIEAGRAWLQRHRPRVMQIRADIDPDNQASLRAFAKAGFAPNKTVYVKTLAGG